VKVFKRDDPKLLEEWAKLIKGTDAGGAKAYIYLKDITKEVESFKDVEIIGECTKIWPAHPEDQNADYSVLKSFSYVIDKMLKKRSEYLADPVSKKTWRK